MAEVSHQKVAARRLSVPVLLCLALIAVVWGVHLSRIWQGGISAYDEFYTLERSVSFGVEGDWLTVYTSHEPNFRKPPLQYWMSAGLMEAGVDQVAALRLPSMIFALGCLGTVALLAALVLPANPWAIPASVLIYASSEAFWRNATAALLDAGTTFFAIISMTLAIIALRAPKWWYAVAVAIGLGALQKAPSALALVVVFLVMVAATSRWHEFKPRRVFLNRDFLIAMVLASCLVVAWPVFQYARYGAIALDVTYSDQMLDRFAPSAEGGASRGLVELARLIIDGEPVLRGLGILALLWMPWALRRFDLLALPLVFLTFTAAMYLASGEVYARYTLIVLPLLAVALATVTMAVAPGRWVAAAAIIVVSVANEGPIKDNGDLRVYPSKRVTERLAMLTEVGGAVTPEETVVVCNWDARDRFAPGAVSIYASEGGPFQSPRSRSSFRRFAQSKRAEGPLRGICKPDEMEELESRIGPVSIVGERFGYLHWVAEAGARPEQ